jgi:hypothetical protein
MPSGALTCQRLGNPEGRRYPKQDCLLSHFPGSLQGYLPLFENPVYQELR